MNWTTVVFGGWRGPKDIKKTPVISGPYVFQGGIILAKDKGMRTRYKAPFQRTSLFTALLAAVLFIQSCGQKIAVQEACGFVQNSQGQRVSWKSTPYFNLYIDTAVPSEYHEAIYFAADQWNEALGRDLLRIQSGVQVGSEIPAKDGYSKIYFLDTWEENRVRTEQARTTIYWAGSRIYEADVRINIAGFSYFMNGSDPTSGKVHLESLLIHEMGHALGLAHVHEHHSVMKPNLAYAQLRKEVGEPDMQSLSCEY